MQKTQRRPGRPPSEKPPSVRATVSMPREIYESLESLAKQKKVSTAWVMRDAMEKYVAAQWPLLEKHS